MSYVATLGIVVVGVLIGLLSTSIRQVWDWLMMAVLGGAFVIPNVLRRYWWRFNGAGYTAGTLTGLVAAMPLLILSPMDMELPIHWTFRRFASCRSLLRSRAPCWTQPTRRGNSRPVYRNVRPFGWWGPIRDRSGLTPEELSDPAECARLAAVNILVAAFAIFAAYIAPMYLVGHWHGRCGVVCRRRRGIEVLRIHLV